MVKSTRIYFLSALAVAVSATNVLVPKHLPTRKLLRDAYAYSLEPVWTEDYISSNLICNLMSVIADITGKPPTFRIGGTTGDQTYYHQSQAAVFADPPWVPDQQDEIDDFDIINLTHAGLTEHNKIGTYAVHLYPQSHCDIVRWYRLSLDLLSNHSVLWHNLLQYVPQVAAVDKAGIALVFVGTNSASCSGRSGISDTFGAALWSVDYVLLAASIGMSEVYFHLGANAEYSSFVPLPYEHKNESLQSGIRCLFYGHYFMAHVLASEKQQYIAQIPTANTSDFSGYAIYSPGSRHHEQLDKLVFIDLQVWNGTRILSNPSTLSTTDSTHQSSGQRPVRQVSITTCWLPGTRLGVIRLQAPGTNAKSDINVSGVSFDPQTGVQIGALETEEIVVGGIGRIRLKMQASEAVLLYRK